MIKQIIDIAVAAGEEILRHYGCSESVQQKNDLSPFTVADQCAHNLIVRALQDLTPGIPALSEEGGAIELDNWKGETRYWLVDPLDGTKEFLNATGEFTVNIALIEGDHPVLGVVHVPVKGITYTGVTGSEARRWQAGKSISIRTRDSNPDQLTVVVSRDHTGPVVEALLARLPKARTVSMGSSFKFCLVAEGLADLYLRDRPTMEWDTGAAQCIVEAAGGRVLDLAGLPLRYRKPAWKNPPIVTVGDDVTDWRSLIESTTLG
ncbi:MAG: 3'(2'),5'-bisphosphate nucleotidase CysQ [Longimicrobiaceae bacterium]